MHLIKRYRKLLLILLLTVGVVCSCCSCATTSATSFDGTQPKPDSLTQKLFSEDYDAVLCMTLSTASACETSDTICRSYSRCVNERLSDSVITRHEWLEMLFDALDIEVTSGLDYYYTRFVDRNYFDGTDHVLTAVDKGVIGPGGTELDPDAAATRQYVSTTLVNAAGYNFKHKLTCKDAGIVKDKKQAATSLYLEYLTLDENGMFNPYKAITESEAQYIAGELENLRKLKGKSLLTFGDSIMHGDGNDFIGIADLVAQRYMMKSKDYSKGGATFGYAKKRQQISNQILAAISEHETADVILIDGGTNDMHKVKAGSVSEDFNYGEHGRVDYASGMEYAFGLLKDNYPNTPVVYIRAHDMVYTNEANELYYGSLALKICDKWDVNTIDMFADSEFDGHDAEIVKKYTVATDRRPNGDSVHPNKDGYYKFYIPMVVSKILELV